MKKNKNILHLHKRLHKSWKSNVYNEFIQGDQLFDLNRPEFTWSFAIILEWYQRSNEVNWIFQNTCWL
jgi:hypothetical protein